MLAILAAALTLAQQTDTQITVRPGTRLDVSNPSGSVVVKAWRDNAVRVHADHTDHDVVVVTLDGQALRVKTSSPRGVPQEVEYVITAPPWMALTLSGVSTNIDVDGAQAAVTAETVSGDVNCLGGAGYVSLKSVSGAIALAQAKGRVELSSVSNDISVRDVAGDVSATAVSGSVRLRDVTSSNVEVATVSGDVQYVGTIVDGGHYRFSTHNGDLTLGMPEKTNATISVSTFNGDFDSSFPVSVTGTSKHHFTFTIGSGSARIDLETFNGDINVKRPAEVEEHE